MRLSPLLQQSVIALALNIATAAVSAVTLDFEELTPTAGACSGALPTTPVETQGFVFATLTAPPGTGLDVCASGPAGRANNGSNYLGVTTRVTFAHNAGLPFFLDGLDASVFTDTSETRTIVISGVRSGGGFSVPFEMPLDPTGLAFQSVDLPLAFTQIALVSIELVGQGEAFGFVVEDAIALDRLRLRFVAPAGIPEPSTFTLVALALVGWRASRAIGHSL